VTAKLFQDKIKCDVKDDDDDMERREGLDKEWIDEKIKQDQQAARVRLKDSLEPTGCLLLIHPIPNIWSHQECDSILSELASIAGEQGWTKKRHAAYDTTDIPSTQAHRIDTKP